MGRQSKRVSNFAIISFLSCRQVDCGLWLVVDCLRVRLRLPPRTHAVSRITSGLLMTEWLQFNPLAERLPNVGLVPLRDFCEEEIAIDLELIVPATWVIRRRQEVSHIDLQSGDQSEFVARRDPADPHLCCPNSVFPTSRL